MNKQLDAIGKRIEFARQELTHFGVTMESEDELTRLRAERDALAERLRQLPDLRSIVGELRKVRVYLANRDVGPALSCVADLLRRLEEPQTTETPE